MSHASGIRARTSRGTAASSGAGGAGPQEGANEEILECPDHQPSSFLKGKPRSILSLLCFENGYFEYLYLLMH